MATVIQAFRYALDPAPEQQARLRSHCGAQRFAFNWGLARVCANLAQREAERSCGLSDDQLVPALSWSAFTLRKSWNQIKDDIAPWWPENSEEACASGLANLATALGNWSDSRAGRRTGPKMRFPRFRGKRSTWSCRFTTGVLGLSDADCRHVRLPRIGVVRTHESTRKLARHLKRGTARIRSATVTLRSGRWFVSFSVEITRAERPAARPESAVGVDLGITSLAVLSTGEIVPNPRHLDRVQRTLHRLQRQAARRTGPDKATKMPPSNRWRKTQSRVARLHHQVAARRRDGLHKLTTRLVRAHGSIVIEDLNVAGMLCNRRVARHLAGIGMAELRRQVEYKARWSGRNLVIADRWFPSSKTCSACGAVKAKLRLSERSYRCGECHLVLDRDLNAARNLACLAGASAAAGPPRVAGRRKTSPMETHVRPASRGQRVSPREDPAARPGQRRREVTAAEQERAHICSSR